MIRKAKKTDLPRIMSIVADTIALMHEEGNVQWNDDYPLEADFLKDISAGTLYVLEQDREVAGFICVDGNEPAEYAGLCWQADPGEAAVIHRMSIAVAGRQKGLGTILFEFAEQTAKAEGKRFIKTDTYSRNPKMNRLFLSRGYDKTGEISFKGRPFAFYCYEKRLDRKINDPATS